MMCNLVFRESFDFHKIFILGLSLSFCLIFNVHIKAFFSSTDRNFALTKKSESAMTVTVYADVKSLILKISIAIYSNYNGQKFQTIFCVCDDYVSNLFVCICEVRKWT